MRREMFPVSEISPASRHSPFDPQHGVRHDASGLPVFTFMYLPSATGATGGRGTDGVKAAVATVAAYAATIPRMSGRAIVIWAFPRTRLGREAKGRLVRMLASRKRPRFAVGGFGDEPGPRYQTQRLVGAPPLNLPD